jgi:hypothetical protein
VTKASWNKTWMEVGCRQRWREEDQARKRNRGTYQFG